MPQEANTIDNVQLPLMKVERKYKDIVKSIIIEIHGHNPFSQILDEFTSRDRIIIYMKLRDRSNIT